MKRILFLSLAVCFVLVAQTQIIITNDDLADEGAIFYEAYDSLPDASIHPGDAGANKVWDFTLTNFHGMDTLLFLSPSNTPYAADFPFSNFAVQLGSDGYAYFNRSDQEFANIGLAGEYEDMGLLVVDIEPEEIYVDFPAQYGDTRSENYKIDVTIESPLPGADSVRFVQRTLKDTHIDAYGSLSLPIGSFDVLRIREDKDIYDSTWAKIFGFWTFIDANLNESTDFSWWSDHPDVGYILCSLSFDETNNVVEDFSYLYQLPVGVNTVNEAEITLYPNPASEQFVLEFEQKTQGVFSLYDVSGSMVLKKNLNQQKQLSIVVSHLKQGVYVYSFSDASLHTITQGKLVVK